ncbi:MAG: thioredoxin family protein [Bacteroidota bacterium]|nr:thioredoxin family protein [Bacteroidota bacterium]
MATKSCSHRHILEDRLNEMKIPFSVQYFEDYPELFEQHDLLSSPNIMVDDVVVFRAHSDMRLPEDAALQLYIGK